MIVSSVHNRDGYGRNGRAVSLVGSCGIPGRHRGSWLYQTPDAPTPHDLTGDSDHLGAQPELLAYAKNGSG